MDPNSSNNKSNLNQEVPPTQDSSRLHQILKTKTYIIFIVLALAAVIFPILYFLMQTVSKNNLPKLPAENPKSTISIPSEANKPTLPPFPSQGDYVKNQLIIEYKEGMSPEEILDNDERSALAQALQDAGIVSQKKLSDTTDPKLKNFYVLTFKEGIDAKEVSTKIYAIPQIKGVEPNGTVEIFK